MNNEQGFTLVEVVASLAIITIILLSFSTIFITNNKQAITNNEKLVIINLADAQLERFRAMAKLIDNTTPIENIEMNGKTYLVTVNYNQTPEETNMGIQNVLITVSTDDNKLSTSVEGYVVYE